MSHFFIPMPLCVLVYVWPGTFFSYYIINVIWLRFFSALAMSVYNCLADLGLPHVTVSVILNSLDVLLLWYLQSQHKGPQEVRVPKKSRFYSRIVADMWI